MGADVDQGRAAGRRFDAADAGRRRHRQPELQRRQPRQAQHRPRPEDAPRGATSSRGWRDRADILIENYRPGVMAALGLDYATLSADEPAADLRVDLRATARPGPQRDKGGFDLVAQGVSGIMSVTGEPGGAAGEGRRADDRSRRRAVRARRHPRRARASRIAPASASTSTRRSSTPASRCRCGKRPSTSAGGGVPGRARIGAPHDRAVSGDPLRRRLHHARRRQRSAVPAAVRRARSPGVGDGPGVCRQRQPRAQPRRRWRRGSKAITVAQPRAHWLALFEANDIPCGPINDYAEVFADPQVLAREMVVEIDHPTLGHCGRSARRSR